MSWGDCELMSLKVGELVGELVDELVGVLVDL